MKYDMNITHVLLNNSSLGKISKEQRDAHFDVWQTSLHNPNFAEFATLCGAKGTRVTDVARLDEALADALAHEGRRWSRSSRTRFSSRRMLKTPYRSESCNERPGHPVWRFGGTLFFNILVYERARPIPRSTSTSRRSNGCWRHRSHPLLCSCGLHRPG